VDPSGLEPLSPPLWAASFPSSPLGDQIRSFAERGSNSHSLVQSQVSCRLEDPRMSQYGRQESNLHLSRSKRAVVPLDHTRKRADDDDETMKVKRNPRRRGGRVTVSLDRPVGENTADQSAVSHAVRAAAVFTQRPTRPRCRSRPSSTRSRATRLEPTWC
jgi:hypothetical protein